MVDSRLSQFKSRQDNNNLTLGRNPKDNSVIFVDDTEENTKYIADAQFNDKSGILSLIKLNGDILEIGGFLTQDQLGNSIQGKKGPVGDDGEDGYDGEDGRKGLEGEIGATGSKGDTGRRGRDGDKGPDGITGKTGCAGNIGDTGTVGDTGDKGFTGEIGKQGISCIKGVVGPQGPQPKTYAHIGEDEPGVEYNLWAIPFTDTLPVLEDPETIILDVNDIDVSLVQINGDIYGVSATHVIDSIVGIKGNVEITWTGDYELDSRISASINANSKTLTLDVVETIEAGQEKVISGNVLLSVRDTFNDDVVSKTLSYKFTGINTQYVDQNLKGSSVDISVVEGNTATFTLNLDQATDKDILVSIKFVGATTRMVDNRSASGLIPAGESSFTISRDILIIGGEQSNDLLQGVFTASSVTEESTGSMTANVTIIEALETTDVVVNDKTYTEADIDKDYLFPVTLSGELESTGSLQYTITNGTAEIGSDFKSTYGVTRKLEFTSSYQTLNIPIEVLGDNIKSGDRSFTINFSEISSNLKLNKTSVTITIKEDDSTVSSSSGGGCVALGTLISTPDGPVRAELLAQGDLVSSRFIKGMPDASQGGKYNEWSSKDISTSPKNSRVERCKLDTYHTLITVNNLNLTPDHPVLVLRQGVIHWQPSAFVVLNDYIETNGGWEKVTFIDMKTGVFDVVTLDVEPHDVFYADGILVHNAESSSFQKR